MPRHTCHIEILVERMDIKDVDGDGQEVGLKGEVKLTERKWAVDTLNAKSVKAFEAPFRILTDAESAEMFPDE